VMTPIADYTVDGSYLGNGSGSENNYALVSGTGSVWGTQSLYVGNGGAGNSLVINNGGLVVDSSGFVGYGSPSSNNSVLVSGSGSVWSNSTVLYVGYAGSANSLIVQDGGVLFTGGTWIGYEPGAVSNTVVITGAGSVWRDTNSVNVSAWGLDSALTISNGGQLFGSSVNVGTFVNGDSTSNLVVVTGTGSAMTLSGSLTLETPGNVLLVSDGGHVCDGLGMVGQASSNNVAVITGTGSSWTNNTGLFIGLDGPNNNLVISNNAQVLDGGWGGWDCVGCNGGGVSNSVHVLDGGVWKSLGLCYIGENGSGNSLTIDGGTVFAGQLVLGGYSPVCDNSIILNSGSLIVTNSHQNAVLEIRNGMLVFNGGTLQVDTLVVTNPCALFLQYGGTLNASNIVLNPSLSAVGDGIPNGWKQQYGLDPFDPALANKDLDGTGLTVLQDYLVGVDPTNPAAAFRITSVAPSGIDLLVTWIMGSGRTNALQATAGDASGGYSTNNFADIFTITNTVGTTTNYLDTGAATNVPARYYRVRLIP